jgi:type VI secretion system protein ImpK
MAEHVSMVVLPVIHYALQLKERLQRGEDADLRTEQGELERRLQRIPGPVNAAVATPASAGTGDSVFGNNPINIDNLLIENEPPVRQMAAGPSSFLGIRYALSCWIDEIFIRDDSPWSEEWAERALEFRLYSTRLRGVSFWKQAEMAERNQTIDALEVYYLCVMLGFRGDARYIPVPQEVPTEERLSHWTEMIRRRISKGRPLRYKDPAHTVPPTNVPPLKARDGFKTMTMVWSACLLLSVLLLGYAIMALGRSLWSS